MILSIVNSIYCFQSLFFFLFFGFVLFFSYRAGPVLVGRNIRSVKKWIGSSDLGIQAEELSGATPFLRPQGFWPILLSSLRSPASVLVYHHTLSSQQITSPGAAHYRYGLTSVWPGTFFFFSLRVDAGSLAGTCHLSDHLSLLVLGEAEQKNLSRAGKGKQKRLRWLQLLFAGKGTSLCFFPYTLACLVDTFSTVHSFLVRTLDKAPWN